MSFLVEQAGGSSCTSEGGSVLDKVPKDVHERSSCWLGSREDIDELKGFLGEEGENNRRRRRTQEEKVKK